MRERRCGEWKQRRRVNGRLRVKMAEGKDAEGKDGIRERTKVRHGYVGVERKSLYL